ncbi:MAG: DNA repair protein RadC [Defluviitaleaceae bacterium]|nr:DNA repair protein RadC [Defluviitaleaceae bacterium]
MSDKKKPHPHGKHRERMRARYMRAGLDAMADHEVLEMLLYYAIPRQDTNKMAHKILSEFGSLHGLFEAGPAEIQKRCGLTENTAVLLSMVAPLARRYSQSKWGKRTVFANTRDLGEYAKALFIGETIECFYLIFLDNRFRLISTELLAKGTIDRVELYPKEIVRRAIYQNASYVVLTHNHPSGSKSISAADIDATSHIINLLDGLEIVVLDHVVVCGEDYVSLAGKRILGLQGIDGALDKT